MYYVIQEKSGQTVAKNKETVKCIVWGSDEGIYCDKSMFPPSLNEVNRTGFQFK